MASAAVCDKANLTLGSLPTELQRAVLEHCDQTDLICLALVSRHFHELASSLLYREFHIIFPNDDESDLDSPIDGLAGGLDTFTTSSYNYAQHLRNLTMDTLSVGFKGENSYGPYVYSTSCGKFLNTLLCLTLKKATALEVFRWNIRVELSRPVYQVLHRIQTLKSLHLRMQAGESYYLPPPPLPVTMDQHHFHWPQNASLSAGIVQTPLFIPAMSSVAPLPVLNSASPAPLHGFPPSHKSTSRTRAGKRTPPPRREPPTVAGFKRLQSLSVLDIENLDIIAEIKTCLSNSSSTLDELALSLSDRRASQARKAPPEDTDDSEDEEEFQIFPTSGSPEHDTSGNAATRALRIREERKIQEEILGKILDVEPLIKSTNVRHVSRDTSLTAKKPENQEDSTTANPSQDYLSSIREVSIRLIELAHGTRDFSSEQLEILEVIEEASKKYIAAQENPTSTAGTAPANSAEPVNRESKSGQDSPSQDSREEVVADVKDSTSVTVNNKPTSDVKDSSSTILAPDGNWTEERSSFSISKNKGLSDDVQPEDIDVERMEGPDVPDDGEDENDTSDPRDTSPVKAPESQLNPRVIATSASSQSNMPNESNVTGQELPSKIRSGTDPVDDDADHRALTGILFDLQQQADTVHLPDLTTRKSTMTDEQIAQTEAAVSELKILKSTISSLHYRLKEMEAASRSTEPRASLSQTAQKHDQMSDYLRSTRGMRLESLSIHLIPVKPSVLSRAIDLRCLRQITLLNVGSQAPIWAMLDKENKIGALPLRSICTDNVSTAFLTFVSHLEEVHELFMLEGGSKARPESFAPPTTTTIDQIRRLVLKKHMGTLKRLMIKDLQLGSSWDANEKTMILICTRGEKLEELALSMSIHAVHVFMQYFSGLVQLRAINIHRFKNSDTCIWVMREVIRFIVDTLSHNPELKLEWIAMEDDRVYRVIRPLLSAESEEQESRTARARTTKGKGKVKTSAPTIGMNEMFPWLPVEGLEAVSDSDEEDEGGNEGYGNSSRLRFKTEGPMQFHDAWGIKIFEKEIRTGKL